jgi:hypothetical protein
MQEGLAMLKQDQVLDFADLCPLERPSSKPTEVTFIAYLEQSIRGDREA